MTSAANVTAAVVAMKYYTAVVFDITSISIARTPVPISSAANFALIARLSL